MVWCPQAMHTKRKCYKYVLFIELVWSLPESLAS